MKKVKALCKEYMDHIERTDGSDCISEGHLEDIQHYIFEATIEHFYGKKVWNKINAAIQ